MTIRVSLRGNIDRETLSHAEMSRPWALALFVSACAANGPPRVQAPTMTPKFALVMPATQPGLSRAAPITLTAEDGTGLALVSLEARIDVTGPLAETELRLKFRNPTDRVVEGRFRLALPPRSFVSRLAMKMNGELREAEAVPLAVARETYESTLFVRKDPLLVEQKKENEITARVFPVDPREEKEIVVGWTSEITDETPVTIPLRGLPAISALGITVRDENGDAWLDRHTNDLAIAEDFQWTPPAGTAAAIRSKDAFVARVRIPANSEADPVGSGLTVLLDTSASRAPDLDSTLDALDSTLAQLAHEEPNARLVLAAFDQEVVPIHDGPIAPLTAAERRTIRTRGALGASDLEAALGWAAHLKSPRVLLVSDGLATAGSAERNSLVLATRALGAKRLDAMTLTSVSDTSLLRALAVGVLERDGVVLERASAKRLRTKVEREVPIAIPGAKSIFPKTFRGVQAGDERLVYAELPSTTTPHVTIGGEVAKLTVASAKTAVRAVAKAHLDALVEDAEKTGWNDAQRTEAIALAEKHELASPLSALLVVEAPPKPVSSAGQRTHTVKAPLMRYSMTIVNGRLPPETIQWVVHQNMGRFRACYEDGLRRNPKLAGRATTKLLIDSTGSVVEAEDGGSDLGDAKVIDCIVHAFEALTFAPPPHTGYVTVVYPLALRPLDEGEEPEPVAPSVHPPVNHNRYHSSWAAEPASPTGSPWTGPYDRAREAISRGALATALAVSTEAVARRIDDATALLALGESLEAAGLLVEAARAYGSIADLHPNRAEMQRTAAVRLSKLGAHPLAVELLRRALRDRPDQPSSHHLLAMALLASGDRAGAKDVLTKAIEQPFPARYVDATRVLATDLAMLERAWHAADPSHVVTGAISSLLDGGGAVYVATWETDASEVAIELPALRTTTQLAHAGGFGPNATIAWDIPEKMAPSVRLARRGSTAETTGVLHVFSVDRTGHITIDTRPFVLMTDVSLAP